ncbi:hypothetical protein [Virgisporangium aliadipatigenens]|nr:hypothetical protein [Virgisporangium aliadipatigenens]
MGASPLSAVWRPVRGRVVVKMPYDPSDRRGNRWWLHEQLGARIRLEYAGGKWTLARTHLRLVVTGLAERFGHVHVHLDYLENQRCDVRCQEALGNDCVCQCAGQFHGGADYQRSWIQVGETALIAANPATRRAHMLVRPD